jgi:hypothetical protein
MGFSRQCLFLTVILSFSETTVAKHKHDLRAGGAWIPEQGAQPAELVAQEKIADTDTDADTTHPTYKYQGMTRSVKTLGESDTARCDMHTVQLKQNTKSTSTVDQVKDWVFLEGPDRVVVAIVDAAGRWIVQRQHRYAIPAHEPVLTPVQGAIMIFENKEESPCDAARRIVLEQSGLITNNVNTKEQESVSTKTGPVLQVLDEYGLQDGKVPDKFQRDWTFLGRYRNLGDQGGGFTYSYLLQNAIPVPGADNDKGGTVDFQAPLNNLGEQPLLVTMGIQHVKQTIKNGDFPEITGVATMSLALLRVAVESS